MGPTCDRTCRVRACAIPVTSANSLAELMKGKDKDFLLRHIQLKEYASCLPAMGLGYMHALNADNMASVPSDSGWKLERIGDDEGDFHEVPLASSFFPSGDFERCCSAG